MEFAGEPKQHLDVCIPCQHIHIRHMKSAANAAQRYLYIHITKGNLRKR